MDDLLEPVGGDERPANETEARVERATVGCLSCATLATASLGLLAGSGLGALFHAFGGGEAGLLHHVAVGGGLGLLLGARLVVPLEEVVVDTVLSRILRRRATSVWCVLRERSPASRDELSSAGSPCVPPARPARARSGAPPSAPPRRHPR